MESVSFRQSGSPELLLPGAEQLARYLLKALRRTDRPAGPAHNKNEKRAADELLPFG
jgi:hypothetical protein